MEAMKMELTLPATRDGIVESLMWPKATRLRKAPFSCR